MSADEAASFEEHYFDCRECADEVRVGAALLEGGRRVVRETPRTSVVSLEKHRQWRNWVPALVAAILVIGLAIPQLFQYFRVTQPVLDIPQVHSLQSATRASVAETPVVRAGDILYVDILGEPSYARYELRFSGPDGKPLLTRAVTPEQARESIPLVLRGWVAGTYELVIVGIDPAGQFAEISRHRFTVKS
ncbi:MAG: hypothetical protein ABI779_11190 [Acidobacteriota bacterium]